MSTTTKDRERLARGTRVRVVRNVVTAQGSYLGAVGTVHSDKPEANPMTEVAVDFPALPGCAFHRAELEVVTA